MIPSPACLFGVRVGGPYGEFAAVGKGHVLDKSGIGAILGSHGVHRNGIAGLQTSAVGPAQPKVPSAATGSPAPIVNPGLPQVSIPETAGEIVAQIGTRNRQIGELIELGRFSDVWFPAFEAKDLALGLTAHTAQIPADKRARLDPAINRLLRAAWLLDAFGDLGNREQITSAYADFRSAVAGIQSLVQEAR